MFNLFNVVVILVSASCVLLCVSAGPSPICKGINERYTNCKKSCPPETCVSTVVQFYCAHEPCRAGCVCKPGFLRRNERSPCLPRCHCPQIRNTTQCLFRPKPVSTPTCKGTNEEYSDCKRKCPPETCLSTVVAFDCAYEPCRAGCVCKLGYLRKDEKSPCMPRCHCPEIRNTTQCRFRPKSVRC